MNKIKYKQLKAKMEMMRVCIWACDVQQSRYGALLIDMIPDGLSRHNMWRRLAREMLQEGFIEETLVEQRIFKRYRYTELGKKWYDEQLVWLRQNADYIKKHLT